MFGRLTRQRAPGWLNNDVVLSNQVSAYAGLGTGYGQQVGQHIGGEVSVQNQQRPVNAAVVQLLRVLLYQTTRTHTHTHTHTQQRGSKHNNTHTQPTGQTNIYNTQSIHHTHIRY